jgi:hypothetical protein
MLFSVVFMFSAIIIDLVPKTFFRTNKENNLVYLKECYLLYYIRGNINILDMSICVYALEEIQMYLSFFLEIFTYDFFWTIYIYIKK